MDAERQVLATTSLHLLVAQLDERVIESRSGRWTAQVIGAHARGDEWWLQLCAAENPSAELLLRLLPGATIESVLVALHAWHPFSTKLQTVVTAPPAPSPPGT